MNNNNNFDNNWGSVPNNNSDNTTETNQQNTASYCYTIAIYSCTNQYDYANWYHASI